MRERRLRVVGYLIYTLPLLFLALFFFYPLVSILRLSFGASGAEIGQTVWALVGQGFFWQLLWFTTWQAVTSTALTLLLGLPLAYAFVHYDFPGKALLRALTTIPFVMPTVVVAAAFTALDRALREELMVELRTILKAVGVTALYVTHDQQEAFTVADRLVVMRQGRIEQIGPPPAIYDTPANAFVAHFLGFHNLLPLAQTNQSPAVAALLRRVQAGLPTLSLNRQADAQLLLRPDTVRTLGCGPSPAMAANVLVVSGCWKRCSSVAVITN